MNNRLIILVAFIVLCSAQLYFPAKIVYDNTMVLNQGTIWKFQCEPVDPNDPFRGKYITLRFNEASILTSDSTDFERNEPVFVTLKKDSIGYAKVDQIYREVPKEKEYIKTSVISSYKSRFNGDDSQYRVRFKFPFTRFYMEESKALPAEQAYRDAQRNDSLDVYALVKVLDGTAALENVYLNDITIKEYVETHSDPDEE